MVRIMDSTIREEKYLQFHDISRAIAHDPEKYPEPHTFNPSRFFDQNGKLNDDDVSYVFGFGRR